MRFTNVYHGPGAVSNVAGFTYDAVRQVNSVSQINIRTGINPTPRDASNGQASQLS